MKYLSGLGLIGLLITGCIIVYLSIQGFQGTNTTQTTTQTSSYQGAIDSAKDARDMLEHPQTNQ